MLGNNTYLVVEYYLGIGVCIIANLGSLREMTVPSVVHSHNVSLLLVSICRHS